MLVVRGFWVGPEIRGRICDGKIYVWTTFRSTVHDACNARRAAAIGSDTVTGQSEMHDANV
jgi:hypothetical protein